MVEESLRDRGLEYEVARTGFAGHAIELTRDAIKRGIELVVAVGGDGTINEVVNGMISGDRAINPTAALGIIPAGT